MQVAGLLKNVESRDLGPLVPLDAVRWEEKTGKAEKEQKPIEVGDKSLKSFAKTSARLQEGRLLV